ncbi:MAG: GIY-YIG nuclease family protein [Sulfuricellaceae bacterium]|nr:GIY-YIG nuclease family protein [Sulfuricellaceae bacterium]
MKPFWVYILRCADGSYYTGHTDNLEYRIGQHQCGECDGYTATRRPVELAWVQECATREEALNAEMQIKGWSRKKKEAMMRGDWGEVSRLARSKSAHASTSSARTDLPITTGVQPTIRPEPFGFAQEILVARQACHDRGIQPVCPELVEGHENDTKNE